MKSTTKPIIEQPSAAEKAAADHRNADVGAFRYIEHHMEWRGIAILIKWCPSWLGATARHQIAHMEVYAANKAPLPITETGYRSNFINKDIVKAAGGPVSYAKAWLDEEARSAGWKAKEQESRQLSLF